jgi:predicted Zn-dependent protease
MGKYFTLFIIITLCFCLCTCGTMGTIVSLGDRFDTITKAVDIWKELTKEPEDFTPEQEYYIGRSVGAVILDKYEPYENENANDYVNTLGQTLAIFSERPEIFEGYHFLILDSEEINAFATPSGLVFVTRGLLKLSTREDSVAAILAHEIGHIVERHGIKSIQKARRTAAVTGVFVDTADEIGVMPLPELTATFTGSIDDIVTKMVVNGYSRENENEADAVAVDILIKIGYDPGALIELLESLDENYTPGGLDFAKTHPAPKKRIDAIEKKLKGFQYVESPSFAQAREQRQARFHAFYKELGY